MGGCSEAMAHRRWFRGDGSRGAAYASTLRGWDSQMVPDVDAPTNKQQHARRPKARARNQKRRREWDSGLRAAGWESGLRAAG
jgi:hypothetical protein